MFTDVARFHFLDICHHTASEMEKIRNFSKDCALKSRSLVQDCLVKTNICVFL